MDEENFINYTTEAEVMPAVTISPVPSSRTLAIASLSLVVALLAILVLFIRRKSGSRGNAVLLVGPSDGGKTAVLSTLVYSQTLPTHTSLQTNISMIALSGPQKTLELIDIPGHPRIRDQFKEYIPKSKAIVFVVDTSTVSRNGPAVAEHLHRVLHALTSIPPSQPTPALLICCHKIDLLKPASASGPTDQLAITRVRTILERELEKRRASQVGGVGIEGLGGEGEEGTEMGGLECSGSSGGSFRFAEWEGGEVGFVGTSVGIGKPSESEDEKNVLDGLSGLRDWLEDLP